MPPNGARSTVGTLSGAGASDFGEGAVPLETSEAHVMPSVTGRPQTGSSLDADGIRRQVAADHHHAKGYALRKKVRVRELWLEFI